MKEFGERIKEFGKRIKQMRKAINLKQGEFARRIGISQSMLSGIESGNETITERNIKLICLEFKVSEVWLRSGEGQMFNPSYSVEEKLTQEEEELISIYRLLLSSNKTVARMMIETLLKSQTPPAAEPEAAVAGYTG